MPPHGRTKYKVSYGKLSESTPKQANKNGPTSMPRSRGNHQEDKKIGGVTLEYLYKKVIQIRVLLQELSSSGHLLAAEGAGSSSGGTIREGR